METPNSAPDSLGLADESGTQTRWPVWSRDVCSYGHCDVPQQRQDKAGSGASAQSGLPKSSRHVPTALRPITAPHAGPDFKTLFVLFYGHVTHALRSRGHACSVTSRMLLWSHHVSSYGH
eukprot:2962375-Rhodomonas_salina.2